MNKHINISNTYKKSLWRKNSIQNWSVRSDSSTYISHDLNITKLLSFCANQNLNPFITFLSISSKALKECPDSNVILHRGRVHYRNEQNVFIHVIEDQKGEELSGYVLYDPWKKDFHTLNKEVSSDLKSIREGNSFFSSSQKISKYIPGFLIGPLMKISGFLLYNLNLNFSYKFLARDCFGSIMISNVGSVGLEQAFIPLVAYTRAHLALAYGKSFKKLIKQNDNIIEEDFVKLGFTFDHRVMDGKHIAEYISKIEELINKL